MMRGWFKAGLALALLAVPLAGRRRKACRTAPKARAFLKAIEEGDAGKAIPLLDEPGSRVANYRGYKGDTALHIVTRKRET